MSAEQRHALRSKIAELQTNIENAEGQTKAWKERASKLQDAKQHLKSELRRLEQEPDPTPEPQELTA